jgi:hypothetical protein
MPPVRLLALGAVLAGPLVLMTVGCTPPKPYANCGAVDQAPNSDVGAAEIQAHGTDCVTARTVADQDYRHANGQPYSYTTWRCTGGIPSGGLGSFVWCNGVNGAVITWRSV